MKHMEAQLRRLGHAIGPVGIMIVFGALGVILFVSVQSRHQAAQVLTQTKSLKTLQEQSVSQTAIVSYLSARTLDCTDPAGACAASQRAQTGAAIASLNAAQAASQADALRKIGQLFVAQGVPKSTVDRILAQPVPTPSPFPGVPVPAPAPPALSPAPAPGIVAPPPAPGPVKCRGLDVPLLNLVRVCIPA